MSRVTPPYGYTWNQYIKLQVSGLTDPEAIRLIKRDIKLGSIAANERFAGGDTTSPSYRDYHIYESPGTVAPTANRPWLSAATDSLAELLLENSDTLITENSYEISAEGPLDTPYDPTPSNVIVTSGLRLYLDAGNTNSYTSGTTWTDLSSNNNDATLVGSPAFTSAGTSSYFTLIANGTKYATTPYTKYSGTYTGKTTFFVARMDAGMTDAYHAIFGASPARTFNTYIYKTGANSQIHASFGSGGGLSNSFALATGQWFTFGITQDSNTIRYYFNGQAVGTTTSQPLGTTYSSGTDPQWIGKADNFWNGDIAVVTIYDRALSGAEMTQNHNAIVGRYGL